MSNQNESLPEAPSAQHPHPAQAPAAQEEEMEQEATVDASKTPTNAVTEASAAAVSGIVSVDGPYATTDDPKRDEAYAPPTQSAPGKGGSHVAGSATPEVHPPTPRNGSLDDTDARAEDQKMQKKVEKPSMTDLPPCPEEVPIEDPCEHRDHVDESGALRTGKKQMNRATEGMVTDANETRSQADNDRAASAETQDMPDIFGDEPSSGQSSPAPQTTPGAVAVPGIDMEIPGTPEDTASDNEAAAYSQEATLQAAIGAYVVNERGQETGAARNAPTDELLREHIFADAPLVSAEAVQDLSESPDADFMSRIFFSRFRSRRTLLILAFLMAIILTAATLMGLLIPQESTAASQEVIQGSQPSAAPSPIPTNCPSHLPSSTPTDPDTLRLNSIQSILVPISGLEAFLDTSTPQYRALEWVSLIDSLQLPYNTEADRKRVVQRYMLAVLYYASGGQRWRRSHHFLEGIHECGWWSWEERSDGTVAAEGALCTKGYKVGVADYLSFFDNNLTGSLPAELQYLTDLEVLEISWNKNLGGPIPGFFGNMTSLARLSLSANMHTGSIPSSLGCLSNLEKLSLDSNRLTGTIPKSFGNLTNLQWLGLSSNMLNGTIPSVLGQLLGLEDLLLYDNRLTATIPESFGNLTRLQRLVLSSNMLNGTIPSVLGQLSVLSRLSLDRNRLTGEIPNELCRRRESGNLALWVDILTANGTEFLCECIPVEGLSGCCVVEPDYVGDGYCDPYEPYYTEACKYDKGDCPVTCPEGTSPVAGENMFSCCVERPYYIGDGKCNDFKAYNTEVCGYDGGDCCESTCEGWECGWNGYDCKDPTVNITCLDTDGLDWCCVEYPSQIGDGYCHPYEPYYMEACKYDNGDCPDACPEGTSPVAGKNMSACCVFNPYYVGDGWCNNEEPYNTAACGWDGGDCCEETCEGFYCGWNAYDCKDPTISIR